MAPNSRSDLQGGQAVLHEWHCLAANGLSNNGESPMAAKQWQSEIEVAHT